MKSKKIIKTCHWELTKRCNLDCLHCISSVGSKKELNKESALKVVDILKSWGCEEVNFTGGEPLIRKDIFDILRKTKENKIRVGLLSNGTLIDNRNIKQIKSYIDEVGISLDGSSNGINDKIRGKGSFKKIINTINFVKKHKIPITLYVTICKLNIGDFENVLKLVKSLKINNIRVNEVTLRGRAYQNRGMLKFDKDTRSGLKQYLMNTLEGNGYNDKNFLSDSSCEIDDKNIFLSPLGYVYPCIEIYQRKPNYHLGNVLEIDRNEFELKINQQMKSKPKNCPYQFMIKDSFALCLNNSLIKCDYGG